MTNQQIRIRDLEYILRQALIDLESDDKAGGVVSLNWDDVVDRNKTIRAAFGELVCEVCEVEIATDFSRAYDTPMCSTCIAASACGEGEGEE